MNPQHEHIAVVNPRLQACTVTEHATLREAMAAVEAGAAGIALVVSCSAHLLGILTDGDIRRALLRGATLGAHVAAHMQPDFTRVMPDSDRAAVLDLMRSRGVSQIPVVDTAGRLLGLHLLREMVTAVERPNWAVVMAGGEGRRLRPLTEHVPKPMLKVAGRPILERLVLQLVGCGVRHIYLAVNYLSHVIEGHFGDGRDHGCTIEYLREQEPLGTAGALSLLEARPRHPLLVMNGDLVTQVSFDAMLRYHDLYSPSATVGVRRYVHRVPFGCVEQRDQEIVAIEEKPALVKTVNGGIYVLSPALVQSVPRSPCGMPDLLEMAIRRGEAIRAFEIDGDWMDVGEIKELRLAVHGH